ncbi:MAG: cytochrome c-type biogenesis protein [Arenimonas sp.]
MKSRVFLSVLMVLSLALGTVASAQQLVYRDSVEEQRFHALAGELRCVMCQNQSLADSNALIAHDLRAKILQLMREGKSDAQIKLYMVERYTEFVLYRPEVKPMTWLLWFGPALLVVAGALLIARILRKHSQGAPTAPAADDGQEW